MKKNDTQALKQKAAQASKLLKNLANPSRLLVLCELVTGSKNVGEIVAATQISQPHVSQLLARFKEEGLAESHRKGRAIFYSLNNECVANIMAALWKEFCKDQRRKV